MGAPEIIAPPSPHEQLACRLYETMERLAPSSADYVAWPQLTQWHRDLYLNCVEALLDDRDLLTRAINLCDDDVVDGRWKEGEELDCHYQVRLSVDGAAPEIHMVEKSIL